MPEPDSARLVPLHDERFALPTPAAEALLDRLLEKRDLRVMVIVAHPDDESIGAGALLHSVSDASVVHVTTGAPQGERVARERGFATPAEYASARRQELLRALSMAGVPPTRVFNLGIDDGQAAHQLVELCRRLKRVLERLKPDIAITHPFEGGHTDHDATAFATHLACGRLRLEGVCNPLVVEFTSYHSRNGERIRGEFLDGWPVPTRTLVLGPALQRLKVDMFRCYRSQHAVLRQFPVDVERFRVAPRYHFCTPPHEGQLEYERHVPGFTREDWCSAAERALGELRRRAPEAPAEADQLPNPPEQERSTNGHFRLA